MLILGHRGARGHAPENTMASFQAALDMGADGIELDVQMTKDGKVVVCHDHSLERTSNGSGWLVEHTREELRALDFGSWFSPQFAGEKIPTLREVLQWAAPTRLIVNVEIKHGPVIYEGIEEKVSALIRECRMVERVIVSSFYHPSLLKILRFCTRFARFFAAARPESEIRRVYLKKEETTARADFSSVQGGKPKV